MSTDSISKSSVIPISKQDIQTFIKDFKPKSTLASNLVSIVHCLTLTCFRQMVSIPVQPTRKMRIPLSTAQGSLSTASITSSACPRKQVAALFAKQVFLHALSLKETLSEADIQTLQKGSFNIEVTVNPEFSSQTDVYLKYDLKVTEGCYRPAVELEAMFTQKSVAHRLLVRREEERRAQQKKAPALPSIPEPEKPTSKPEVADIPAPSTEAPADEKKPKEETSPLADTKTIPASDTPSTEAPAAIEKTAEEKKEDTSEVDALLKLLPKRAPAHMPALGTQPTDEVLAKAFAYARRNASTILAQQRVSTVLESLRQLEPQCKEKLRILASTSPASAKIRDLIKIV